MNFAAPELCRRVFELTGVTAYWTWDCSGVEPRISRSTESFGNTCWPAYSLGELYRMNPRATTWFKKETPRLGGMCSARTDKMAHYAARADTPENAAATLQIAYEAAQLKPSGAAIATVSGGLTLGNGRSSFKNDHLLGEQ